MANVPANVFDFRITDLPELATVREYAEGLDFEVSDYIKCKIVTTILLANGVTFVTRRGVAPNSHIIHSSLRVEQYRALTRPGEVMAVVPPVG